MDCGPFNNIGMVMHVFIWQIVVVVLHSMVYGTFIIIMSLRGDILYSPMYPPICLYICLSQNRVSSRTLKPFEIFR